MRWGVWGWFKGVIILVLVSPKIGFTLPPSSLRQFKNCVAADLKIGSENCVAAYSKIGSENCVPANF
jgi:hypothetical protein